MQSRSPVPVLVGRDAEREELSGLLRRVADGGRSRVIEGDPGIGKSALLAVIESEARERGFWSLRCSGVENASPTGYLALRQLLRPLIPYVSTLPVRQRQAL